MILISWTLNLTQSYKIIYIRWDLYPLIYCSYVFSLVDAISNIQRGARRNSM